MSKTIRNTLFTVAILTLTALGVEWNREIAKQQTPVAIGETVLAEFAGGEASSGQFNLEVKLSRTNVLLGQYQVVSVQTLPFAQLDIALIKPDGTFDQEQTVRAVADELGRYSQRFRLDDFHALGRFELMIKARSGDQSAASRAVFTLQTWDRPAAKEEILHPILP